MAKVTYVEKKESIDEVIDHLNETSEKQVIFVVPKQAVLFEDAENLSFLKSRGDDLDKHITIISLDISGLAMATSAGLEVSKPKKSANEEIELPMLEEKKSTHSSVLKKIWTFKQKRKIPIKMRVFRGAVMITILIFGGMIFWYAMIARTDIYLKVTPQPFSSNIQIMIDSRALEDKEVDGQLIIPGRLVTRSLSIHDTFSSTGQKITGDKASGEVIFYNFTEDTIIVNSDDTILRNGNFRFKIKADTLRIRPTAFIGLEGKKIDPTSLVVSQSIEAEELGEEYNLSSGMKFEVINSKLNIDSNLLYAQNNHSFSGGFKKEIRVINQSDIDKAMEILSDRISNDALVELSKSLKKGEKIVQDKYEVEMSKQKIEPTLGSEAPTFTMSVSTHISGLAYDRVFLEKLVKNKILNSVPSGSTIDQEDQLLSLSLKDVDIATGRAQIVNDFNGTLHPAFDNPDFKYTLRGKSEMELKNYFLNKPIVESVEIKFHPTWLRYASWLDGRIFIQME